MVVRGSLVTAVVEDIRSSVGGGLGESLARERRGECRVNGDDDQQQQQRQQLASMKNTTRRSVSPAKRKKEHDGNHGVSQGRYDDGDGLAVLLKACEILDKDLKIRNSVTVKREGGESSIKKEDEDGGCPSPAKSPRKSSRSCSPSKPRLEKPQGPCTNSHCLNPNESPQWRRGPPEAPVLCNACGTRWIRNKSLVPLVPQRGIRYNNGTGASNARRVSPCKKKGVRKEEEHAVRSDAKSAQDDNIGSRTVDDVCHQKEEDDGRKSSKNKNDKPFFTIVASATGASK